MLDRSKLIPDTDGFYCKHRLPCSISTLWQHATSLQCYSKTKHIASQNSNGSEPASQHIPTLSLIYIGIYIVHASLNILHSPPSPITKCAVYFPFPPLLHPPILPLLLLFSPSVKRRMNWTLFSHI